MNRLNPLYLILLSLTIVFVSFFSLSNEKKFYLEKVDESKLLQQKASEYLSFIGHWKDEKFINKTIDDILKNSLFKNEQITKTTSKESIKIRIESSNQQVLDNFLNRFLNKQLMIKNLEIDKNFINLEVGLK